MNKNRIAKDAKKQNFSMAELVASWLCGLENWDSNPCDMKNLLSFMALSFINFNLVCC
jgi:hypothetical protein